jgi:hypothetical protein
LRKVRSRRSIRGAEARTQRFTTCEKIPLMD